MANISIKKDFKDGDKLLAQQLNNNFSVIEAGVNANEADLENVIQDAENRLKTELEAITADRGWDWNEGDRVTFFKGSEEEVANQEVKDGQLLYNETTGETYLDNGGKRIVTGSGNVVSIGEEEPTNTATKIWIDPEEIGEPLPHQLVVSPEEPTTGEEVWFKKSDNYLDTRAFVNETKNGLTLTYDNGLFTITGTATASTSFLINYNFPVSYVGKTYTLSAIGNTTGITNFGFKSTGGSDKFIVNNGVSKTVEMTQQIISEVGRFDFYIGSGQTVNASFYVQLTQGEEIPETYTPYVDKEIYVKNDNGVYEEFINVEKLKGTVLFDGYANEDVTLADSTANYDYIEIAFSNNDGIYNSVRVYKPNGKKVSLSSMHTNDSYTYIKSRPVLVDGARITSIATNYYAQVRFGSDGAVYTKDVNYIYINKVIGYKH